MASPAYGSIRCIRQKSDTPRLLDRIVKLSLMRGTDARNPSRQNLRALRNELGQEFHIFVVNGVNLLHTKLADFSTSVKLLLSHQDSPAF
jgi:hypothetical protein